MDITSYMGRKGHYEEVSVEEQAAFKDFEARYDALRDEGLGKNWWFEGADGEEYPSLHRRWIWDE